MQNLPSVLAVAVVAAVACSDPFKPTIDNVAGDYSLERLLIITDTGGTTAGHLFVPGGEEGGDSFVRDYVWTARANRIVTDRSIPGQRVIVVLRK